MPDTLFSSEIARATLLQAEGDHEAALRSLQEAANCAMAEFGSDDTRVAAALEQQVAVLRALGRSRQADDVLEHATKIRLAHVRRSGRALETEQKYAEAEQLFREALTISEHAYGKEHRETATCLDNLATCLRKQGRYVDAVTACSKALAIREAVLGKHHSHTAASCCNLGFLYRTLGRYNEAQTLLAQSLVIRERTLGEGHPYVAESLDRLAGLCRDLGRFEEASRFCERALKIRRESLGDDHPLTAASLNNLALSREERFGDAPKPISRSGTDGHPSTSADDLADPWEPASADLPKDSPSSRRRREHTPQQAESWSSRVVLRTAVGMLVGLAGAGLAFWFLPAAGIAFAAAIVVLGIGSLSGIISFESMLLRAGRALGSALVRPSESAHDRVYLGELADTHDLKLGSDASRNVLTSRHAKALAQLDHVDLDHVSVLTLAAAEELGRQRGTLRLNGIKAVRSKLARPLSEHVGCLQLNGATLVSPAAAAHLSRHAGDLHLNALTEITTEHAEHLAHHAGALQLNGLRTLDEESASWLLRHHGRLTLLGLRLVSRQTARLLRTNTAIQLPSGLGEGM